MLVYGDAWVVLENRSRPIPRHHHVHNGSNLTLPLPLTLPLGVGIPLHPSFFWSCFILFMQLNHCLMKNKQDDYIFITLQKIYSRGHEGVTFRNINSSEGHKEEEWRNHFGPLALWDITTSLPNLQKAPYQEQMIDLCFFLAFFRIIYPIHSFAELLQCFGIKTDRDRKRFVFILMKWFPKQCSFNYRGGNIDQNVTEYCWCWIHMLWCRLIW